MFVETHHSDLIPPEKIVGAMKNRVELCSRVQHTLRKKNVSCGMSKRGFRKRAKFRSMSHSFLLRNESGNTVIIPFYLPLFFSLWAAKNVD